MPKVFNKRNEPITKGAVYVGRPSKWGNPFKIGRDGNREGVIEAYRQYALRRLADEPNWLDSLRDKDLVCFCAPLPCHADILLELANK